MASPRLPESTILSASRRTDIPAFYLDWFMAGIEAGTFEVENPYNRRRRIVPARPHEIHSIVFWSKNFGPFLHRQIGETLEQRGYRMFFNFSLNSTAPALEPHVPSLKNRLPQLEELAKRFDPRSIFWRFDPVCLYRRAPNTAIEDNIGQLDRIAATASRSGVRQCVTSFVDRYPKVQRRAHRAGITLEDPPPEIKAAILQRMADTLRDLGIQLYTCCEKDIHAYLATESGILNGACIPGEQLAQLYGPGFNRQRDRGQRTRAGCGCNVAIDIGSYHRQPCYHDCLFCYARPKAPVKPCPAGNQRV
jgi:hypothetical protein